MHGLPIVALPNATHFAVPFVSTTSHVSLFAQPHCGTTPHALLGAVVLQLLGGGSSAGGGSSSSVPIGVEAGSYAGGAPSSSAFGVEGSDVLSAKPFRAVVSLLHATSANSGAAANAKTARRVIIAPKN